MAEVHYFIEQPGPRSRHIIGHVLGRMTGWQAIEVASLEEFRDVEGPKLIYGSTGAEGAFWIVPGGLLTETGIKAGDPPMGETDGIPFLYPSADGDLPFDLFAGAFFLLSRMEEYGDMARDSYARPMTAQLHAARHGYLERPVVDEWLGLLADAWRAKDPRLPALRRTYSHTATLDVDNGAMYLGREWWRTVGSLVRDLLRGRALRVRDRFATLLGLRTDPYAVHGRFLDLAQEHGARAIVNFLASPRGPHDHAIAIQGRYMRNVVTTVMPRAVAGLHPSFSSSDEPRLIAEEKQRLEQVLGHPVTCSRQHFLRLRLPDTMRALHALGIREEHSLGLHDRIGFRAGTCTPFPFYDLGEEKPLPLMMHPFAVMDSTLAYQLHLSPRKAAAEAKRMVDAVRAVKGTFISVWHERFLSGYGDEAGWGDLCQEVLQHARP